MRRAFRRFLMAAAVMGPLLLAREELPLPPWEDAFVKGAEEEQRWMAGELLLGADVVPEELLADDALQPLDFEPPTAEELAGDGEPSSEIPAEFLSAYFDARPEGYLLDPQGLLSTAERRDRTSFLEYHAGDSTVDLFLYVFAGDQEIPGEVRKEEMMERFFSEGRPAAVVFYYLGFPQRSEVFLSPSLTDVVSASEQRRALQSSVSQAFGKIDPGAQLEAFLVQMAIRIYWMERMIEGGGEPVDEASVIAAESQAGGKGGLDPWLVEMWERWGVKASAGLAGLVAFAVLWLWWRSRASYRFPEFDVEPRLGGAHGAGVGAVISFSSASVPPASQRDQVPDYLRRA
jgi:hypothetical protein